MILESIVILMVLSIIVIWFLNLKAKKKLKKIREEYNAEENKSRPSEDFRREFRRDRKLNEGDRGIEKSKPNVEPTRIVEERRTLSDDDVIKSREYKRNTKEDWQDFS